MNTTNSQIPPGVASPPAGYALFMVRKWGDPIMVAQGEYSVEQRHGVGTFQVVDCYVPETRQFTSISNFNKLKHEDMVNLARTQLIHFGLDFNMTLEQIRKMEGKPLDGFNLKQKMAWLYEPLKGGGGAPGLEFWGVGEWHETKEGRFGTMVRGGQMVACTTQTFDVMCRTTGEKKERLLKMRKLLPFRRSDWGRKHTEYPWLVQKCTVALKPGSRYSESPKGVIYAPVALDWRDFPFTGKTVPSAYYLPDEWLTEF